MTAVDPSSVNVPRELVEALRTVLDWREKNGGYGSIIEAARALVDAAERPDEGEPYWSRRLRCECPPYSQQVCDVCQGVAPPVPVSDEAEVDHSAERKALSYAAYMFALNHPLYGPSTTQAVIDWINAFKDEHYPARLAGKDDER